MRLPLLAALPLLAFASHAHAYSVTYGTLPAFADIYAPTPNSSFVLGPPANPPQNGATYVGLTQSYSVALSPFAGVTGYENAPYDSVSGGGEACFGICGRISSAAVSSSMSFQFGGDNFTFIYGSPDKYNELTLYYVDPIKGATSTKFKGDPDEKNSIVEPGHPLASGYEVVTISGLGSVYGAKFESDANAFEFSAYGAPSYVPLPASAPMFGAALVVLGAVGYGLNRRKAATAA